MNKINGLDVLVVTKVSPITMTAEELTGSFLSFIRQQLTDAYYPKQSGMIVDPMSLTIPQIWINSNIGEPVLAESSIYLLSAFNSGKEVIVNLSIPKGGILNKVCLIWNVEENRFTAFPEAIVSMNVGFNLIRFNGFVTDYMAELGGVANLVNF